MVHGPINLRFEGHFVSFKKKKKNNNNNNNNSKLSEHLPQNGHSFGKINGIMEILSLPKGNTFGYRRESIYLQRISYRKLGQG